MMKLYNLILESNDSNVTYTELTPVDRKLLQFMYDKGISQNNDKLIYKFLKDTLAIDDLETQVRLINLYMLNAPSAREHKRGFLDMDKVVELDTTASNDYIKVLSEFKGIPETFVVEEYKGQINDAYDTYLPEYRIFDVARGQYESYVIARDNGEAWKAAQTRVHNIIRNEGYDALNQEWLMDYVKIDEEEIELYIRETTEERARDYDEDELREELFGYNSDEWNEYEGAEDDTKLYKEEIKKLSLEIQEKEFKKDNVESELIVLEKDIERLDYYSDDETNYRDMEYSEEIEELQSTYNNYKRIFDELEVYLEESYRELDKLQTNLEESKTILEKYSGESLMDLYVNTITQSKVEEALTDIEWFLDYVNMEIYEAVSYGYLDIDDDEVIEAAIEADGLGHWLAGYDGYENEETITQEDGNYSDTFYLFRNN